MTTPSGSFTTTDALAVLPRVTGFSPASAQTGATLTIAGTTLASATAVTVGGVAAAITGASPLTVTVPDAAVSGKVAVTTPAGTSTSDDSFSVLPHVTGFAPASGAEGTTVTIDGSGFGDVTDVRFGGVSATPTQVSVNRVTAVVPPGAEEGTITVVTPAGSDASTGSFQVIPALTGFSPTSGPEGATVTLTGTSLGLVTAVDFNGTEASFTAGSPITATVPAGATTGPIHVHTLDGSSLASAGDFTVTPTVGSLEPTSAHAGDTVTVHGTTLGGATAVTIGGVDAAFTAVDPGTLSVTVPAAAVSGQVAVTTPGGVATSAGTLTVLPRVTGFDPATGPVGTTVTIAGSGLGGATGVSFGNTAATTFTPLSANSVTAVVPAGAASGAITVTTPAGSDTSAGSFTVVVPTVDGFTPGSGVAGTEVTITGTHLDGATAVSFGDGSAPVDSSSATTVTAAVPQSATTGPVSVTTPAGIATSADSFSVLPHVASFAPSSGPAGTTVTIDGSGLGGATGVNFGGVSATTVTPVSVNEVTAVVPDTAVSGPITMITPAGSGDSTGSFTVVAIPANGAEAIADPFVVVPTIASIAKDEIP